MAIFTKYQEAVKRLESSIRTMNTSYMDMDVESAGVFFMERARRFYDRLGSPHVGPKYIHVAGTSGKGSTSGMLYNILLQAGYNVGLYTSPFVTTSLERMEVNGKLIDPTLFIESVNEAMDVFDDMMNTEPEKAPSYSEVFEGVAFLAFQKAGVEWLVLETSCGGRYDMSNVIPPPEVCVITNIGLDHTAILGDTVEKIAWHKAGIIKEGAAVFSAETKESVRDVFNAEAAQYNAAVQYTAPETKYVTHMPGEHQQYNAALAAAVGKHLAVNDDAIRAGIANTRLPARGELMQEHPRVIIDGAHSIPKMEALVNMLKSDVDWNKLHLIFAAKESRSVDDVLQPLAPLCDTATMTAFQLPGFGSHSPEAVADAFQQYNTTVQPRTEPIAQKALESVLATAAPDDLILITGSLYVAGELREYWLKTEDIIEKRSVFPTGA